MEDVSLSGAFVHTVFHPPLFSHVYVELDRVSAMRGGRQRISAYVVRRTADGIGLEWFEFAPEAIRDWVASAASATAKPWVSQASSCQTVTPA